MTGIYLHKWYSCWYKPQGKTTTQKKPLEPHHKLRGILRIKIDSTDKKILEKIYDRKISQQIPRNAHPENKKYLKSLLSLGKTNAQEYLNRYLQNQKLNILEENRLFKNLQVLQSKLNLNKVPRVIECYDISHLQGKYVYGSMITFTDGLPNKKKYRLFKIKDQNNDYKSLQEVLTRRLGNWLDIEIAKKHDESIEFFNKWSLPDLIIIDGGKGQLNSVNKIINHFRQLASKNGFSFEVEICSLAKRIEEVFLPSHTEPILLEGELKFLVQRIRDEAHRFGITNNRKARIKKIKDNEFSKIPGFGPKTNQKLLNHFGSYQNTIEHLYKDSDIFYELIGKQKTKILLKKYGVV